MAISTLKVLKYSPPKQEEKKTRTNPFNGLADSMEGDISRTLNAQLGIPDLQNEDSGNFGLTKTEELEYAISDCKQQIKKLSSCNEGEAASEKRRAWVQKLIELRIALHELKEGPLEPGARENEQKTIFGHKFACQEAHRANRYCEKCNAIIWVLLQKWFKCSICGYSAHEKCLHLVTRKCAGETVKELFMQQMSPSRKNREKSNPSLLEEAICPEKGLAVQNYRCAECKTRLSLNLRECDGEEPRLCDYSGLYFCPSCHWNDVMVVPSRVVHNWDFEPQKVSRSTKQFLKIMATKAVINLEKSNSQLFSYIEELRFIRKVRKDILIMKCYFLSCKEARNERILLQLKKRQHFVESHEYYSIQDLLDVNSGALVVELEGILQVFRQHIKADCEVCRGNGFVCELCSDKDVIFPFDDYVSVCKHCFAVFHRLCFEKRRKNCPRCIRREERRVSLAAAPITPDSDPEDDFLPPKENPPSSSSPETGLDVSAELPPAPNNSLNPFESEQEFEAFKVYDDTLNPFVAD